MVKSRIFQGILFLLLMYGCHNKGTAYSFNDFPQTSYLSGKVENISLRINGAFLECVDSFLVLTTLPDYPWQVLLLDLKTFDHISSAGPVGEGPAEIGAIGLSLADPSSRIIWYHDIGKNRLLKFTIDSILRDTSYFPGKPVPLKGLFMPLQLSALNDSVLAFSGVFPESFVSFISTDGLIIDSLSVPSSGGLYHQEDMSFESMVYLSYYSFLINRARSRIAIVYKYSDAIDIINFKGEVILRIIGPGRISQIPDYKTVNPIMTNTITKCDEDFIYCLYKNNRRFDESSAFLPIYDSMMNVFSWDGKPLLQLRFSYPAATFSIDRRNDRIITYSPEVNDLVTYSFDFDRLLN